jgi:hypothetical protein
MADLSWETSERRQWAIATHLRTSSESLYQRALDVDQLTVRKFRVVERDGATRGIVAQSTFWGYWGSAVTASVDPEPVFRHCRSI